jgi:hypothetical protein
MNTNDKALEIIENHKNHQETIKNCQRAGICETCGRKLKSELIRKHQFSHQNITYKKNGFLKKRTKLVTNVYIPAVKIFCEKNHQEYIQESRNWGEYSDTLSEDILQNLKNLPYSYDDDDDSY